MYLYTPLNKYQKAIVGTAASLAHSGYTIGSNIYNGYSSLNKWRKRSGSNFAKHWRFKRMPPARRSRSAPRTPRQVARIAAVSSLRTPARSASRGRTPQRATSAARSVSFSRTSTGSMSGPGVAGVVGKNTGLALTTRKVKKSKKTRMNKRGVDFTMETGGATDSKQCVYIGHASCPVIQMEIIGITALFKELFLQAGAEVTDIEKGLEVQAGDKVIVRFGYHTEAGTSLDTYTASTGDSILNVVAWFRSPSRGWNIVNEDMDQREFYSIQYLPVPETAFLRPTVLMMKKARIGFIVKSVLKIQNRSVPNVTDNEITDVDNIPLIGRTYEGKGTGAIYIAPPPQSGSRPTFYANKENSVILAEWLTTGDGAPNEPPETEQFDKITKEGKMSLDPGQIKMSTLTWEKKMPFNDYWNMMKPPGTRNTLNKPFGKFRMFAIEKMIQFTADADDSAIRTVYEINMDMSSGMSFSRTYGSTKLTAAYRDQDI